MGEPGRRGGDAGGSIAIMVVDDHPMWRQTMGQVIDAAGLGTLVAEADTGEEALAAAAAAQPNVIVMDLNLPGLDGISATEALRALLPAVRVLVLSASDERKDVLDAMRAGASGYLLKTAQPADVVDAIRRVHRGELVVPAEMTEAVLDELRRSPSERGPLRVLVESASSLFREALARALADAGFDVVDADPDIVVVETSQPGRHDLEAHRGTPVVVVAPHIDIRTAQTLVEDATSGVGYLLAGRMTDIEKLADTIRRVAVGESVIDPDVASELLSARRRRDPMDDLTPREREVLALMAEGRSNQAICEQLVVSTRAIEGHVRNIFMKLGLEPTTDDHRRVLAVLAYLRSPQA